MRHARAFVATVLVSPLLWAAPAQATWIANGNPICTATGEQNNVQVVTDGAGGTFVLWLDQRRGAGLTDVYATRLLANGDIAAGWPVNGKPLAETGLAGFPSGMPDGAGGLIVVWFDLSTYQARMQHVSGAGGFAAGFPANGKILPITVGGPAGWNVFAASDGGSGAYVLWNAYVSVEQLFVTRLTGDGTIATGWSSTGLGVGGGAFMQSFWSLQIQSDPAGGALTGSILVFEDEPSGSSRYGYVCKTFPNATNGVFAAVSPTGHLPIPGSHAYVTSMSQWPDGIGGAFAAWNVSNTSSKYMQHYLANGSPSWPDSTPAPACDAMFGDGAGGIHLLGRPAGTDRLELHRRAAAGEIPAGWPAAGVVLSPVGPYNSFLGTRSGGNAVVAWVVGAAGAQSLRATAIEPDGEAAPGWTVGGTVLSSVPGTKLLGGLVAGNAWDALMAWTDYRSGAADVYATHMVADALLDVPGPPAAGSALAIERIAPNPARGSAFARYVLPTDAPAEIEIVDVAGRVRRRLQAAQLAGRQESVLALDGLDAGVYWLRLRQAGHTATLRFAVIR